MLIAGNWKMFKGPAEATEFCRALREADTGDADVVVCPPYVSLAAAVTALADTEIGVRSVVLGHSERRQYFGETDETVARRVLAALQAGLGVIACVGESEEEREAGQTELILRVQTEAIADARGDSDNLVIAYEPVWAIGTGRTATPELAAEAHALVKGILDVPVLYGGSVNADNAAELLARDAVDGALVGGASLEVDSFTAICRTAASLSS